MLREALQHPGPPGFIQRMQCAVVPLRRLGQLLLSGCAAGLSAAYAPAQRAAALHAVGHGLHGMAVEWQRPVAGCSTLEVLLVTLPTQLKVKHGHCAAEDRVRLATVQRRHTVQGDDWPGYAQFSGVSGPKSPGPTRCLHSASSSRRKPAGLDA